MSRLSGRVLWTVVALAVVVAAAQVAEAQREGGRRGGGRGFGRGFGGGGFGISAVQLVAQAEEVQTALNLTEDQKTKVEEINDQLREDRRDLFQQGGGGDFRAMREDMEKLNNEAAAKLAEVLDDNQKQRLMGIQIQVNGANSLFDAAIAKKLGVTEDQKSKLEEARQENMESMRDAMEDLRDQDLSREEMGAKMQELRTESDKKLLAALTEGQQADYEALKGDPVEVDMSQFRGGFGGRGGGGRGEGRGRGGRDRDNDGGDNDRGA
jgi:Spy/CpxP family protein refolding chaperone